MPNNGNYGRTSKKYYSIGGDVSGIQPLNEYCIPAKVAVDARKILDVVGNGTRCLWYEGVKITTDKTREEIAKMLEIPVKYIVDGSQKRMR